MPPRLAGRNRTRGAGVRSDDRLGAGPSAVGWTKREYRGCFRTSLHPALPEADEFEEGPARREGARRIRTSGPVTANYVGRDEVRCGSGRRVHRHGSPQGHKMVRRRDDRLVPARLHVFIADRPAVVGCMIREFLIATFGNGFPFGAMVLEVRSSPTVRLPLAGTGHESTSLGGHCHEAFGLFVFTASVRRRPSPVGRVHCRR